jgi:hypothetical protein
LLLPELENVEEIKIENLPFAPDRFQTWADKYLDEDFVYLPLTEEDIVEEILSNKTTNEKSILQMKLKKSNQTPTNQKLIAALRIVGLGVKKIPNINLNNFLR